MSKKTLVITSLRIPMLFNRARYRRGISFCPVYISGELKKSYLIFSFRFTRYGHTLSPVDINGDGVSDVMLLAGGYAPSPMNDQWITEDGKNWV